MARQGNPQQKRYRVAIVGDGQTERIYFDNIRDADRPGNLVIFPDSPKKIGNYKGVLERAEILTEDYDRVYALIDFDKSHNFVKIPPIQNQYARAYTTR